MSKSKVKLARQLAKEGHKHQKYGLEDYFNYHVFGVVTSLVLHGFCNKIIIVGYLHDLVEDTDTTLDTIENLFGTEIRDAVDAITKREGESRQTYLERVRRNSIARIVKVHDALFNLSNCYKNKNKSNYNKYINTIAQLNQE